MMPCAAALLLPSTAPADDHSQALSVAPQSKQVMSQMSKTSIISKPLSGEPQEEREHFMKCHDCGRWFDMRNADDVLAHEQACDGALAPASAH
jgi:hypothetical protein